MSLTLQFDPTTDNVVILKTITQHPITGAVMTDAMCDGALLIKDASTNTYQQRILPNATIDINELILYKDGITDNFAAMSFILPLLTFYGAKILVTSGVYLFSTNISFPKNIKFEFSGGVFQAASAVSITFNSKVIAGIQQAFSGAGICSLLKNPSVKPEWWGAVANDDTVNCTFAVTQAIAHINSRGGGEILIATGTYYCWPTAPAVSSSDSIFNLVNIKYIKFKGEGKYTSILSFWTYNTTNPSVKGDPVTTWEVVLNGKNSEVHRGNGFRVTGCKMVVFEDLTLQGNTLSTGQHYYPSPTSGPMAGDGWDLTHKAIYAYDSLMTNSMYVTRCYLSGWRGEIVYVGGLLPTTVRDTELSQSNGSIISASCREVSGCEIHDGYSGMENASSGVPSKYINNHIYNISGNGITDGGATNAADAAKCTPRIISGNYIENCAINGILLIRNMRNVNINNNDIVDCDTGISINPYDGECRDVSVDYNRVYCKTKTISSGIMLAPNSVTSNIRITNNTVRPMYAATEGGNNFYINYGLYVYPNGSWDGSTIQIISNHFQSQHVTAITSGKKPFFKDNTAIVSYDQSGNHNSSCLWYGPTTSFTITLLWDIMSIAFSQVVSGLPATEVDSIVDISASTVQPNQKVRLISKQLSHTITFQKSNTNFVLPADIVLKPLDFIDLMELNSKWIFVATSAIYLPVVIEDSSATLYSLATINATYPDVPTGSQIVCPNQSYTFIKTAPGVWYKQSITVLT